MVKIIQGLGAVLLGRLLLAQKTWDMHQWHLVGSKKMFVSTLCHHLGWKRDFFPQVPRKWFVEDVRNGNYSSRHFCEGGGEQPLCLQYCETSPNSSFRVSCSACSASCLSRSSSSITHPEQSGFSPEFWNKKNRDKKCYEDLSGN